MKSKLACVAISALALASFLSAAAPAGKVKAPAKPSDPSEQGTWKVRVTPDADAAAKGEKEFDDTLILHKGKFRSAACVPYGFDTASYRVEAGTWMADAQSPKEGKNHWHGEVSGDSVSGRLTWTKADGMILNYTFRGTRVGGQGGQTQTSPSAPTGDSKNRD